MKYIHVQIKLHRCLMAAENCATHRQCYKLPRLQQTKNAFLWKNRRLNSSIQNQILHFFTKQINSRSVGSWFIKGREKSSPRVDFSVPLMHHIIIIRVMLNFPKEMLPKFQVFDKQNGSFRLTSKYSLCFYLNFKNPNAFWALPLQHRLR